MAHTHTHKRSKHTCTRARVHARRRVVTYVGVHAHVFLRTCTRMRNRTWCTTFSCCPVASAVPVCANARCAFAFPFPARKNPPASGSPRNVPAGRPPFSAVGRQPAHGAEAEGAKGPLRAADVRPLLRGQRAGHRRGPGHAPRRLSSASFWQNLNATVPNFLISTHFLGPVGQRVSVCWGGGGVLVVALLSSLPSLSCHSLFVGRQFVAFFLPTRPCDKRQVGHCDPARASHCFPGPATQGSARRSSGGLRVTSTRQSPCYFLGHNEQLPASFFFSV